jgi:hypothetical protein
LNYGLTDNAFHSSALKVNSSSSKRSKLLHLSEHVLAATTLQWDFPGCAVSIPYKVFDDDSFLNELAGFLEQASTESVKRFAPKSYKQGATVSEIRNTVDPGLITQILIPLLEANGKRVFPSVLRKHVRDEVSWDGAEKPWRRCPFWLVLRVAVEIQLSRSLGGEVGRVQYKFLMCLMMAQFLEDSVNMFSKSPELELVVLLKAKLCRRIAKLKVDKDRVSISCMWPLFRAMTANILCF